MMMMMDIYIAPAIHAIVACSVRIGLHNRRAQEIQYKQTNTQTNKTNKQTQTNKQTDKQTNKQIHSNYITPLVPPVDCTFKIPIFVYLIYTMHNTLKQEPLSQFNLNNPARCACPTLSMQLS